MTPYLCAIAAVLTLAALCGGVEAYLRRRDDAE